MTNSKIYLNVPYAEKDAAKAVGAKWDATNKKWFVSSELDITLFAKWQSSSITQTTPLKAKAKSSKLVNTVVVNHTPGVITYPADKDFVAYNGEQPPWNK